jgi:hypothetical protein
VYTVQRPHVLSFDKSRNGPIAVRSSITWAVSDEGVSRMNGIPCLSFSTFRRFNQNVPFVASCGDHEGTLATVQSVVSVLALGLTALGAHSPTEMR